MKAMSGETQCWTVGWGVRIRETKYFIFFREIRYKQREHNYWIEKAGGWRIKIPFCKTYEETRIANWILVDGPFVILYFGLFFLALLFADATAEWLKAIQDPLGERQGAL